MMLHNVEHSDHKPKKTTHNAISLLYAKRSSSNVSLPDTSGLEAVQVLKAGLDSTRLLGLNLDLSTVLTSLYSWGISCEDYDMFM